MSDKILVYRKAEYSELRQGDHVLVEPKSYSEPKEVVIDHINYYRDGVISFQGAYANYIAHFDSKYDDIYVKRLVDVRELLSQTS